MGKYKNEGDPALALAEECAEVIHCITKKHRFNGTWDEVPIDSNEPRWNKLESEMNDLFYQWERLKKEHYNL